MTQFTVVYETAHKNTAINDIAEFFEQTELPQFYDTLVYSFATEYDSFCTVITNEETKVTKIIYAAHKSKEVADQKTKILQRASFDDYFHWDLKNNHVAWSRDHDKDTEKYWRALPDRHMQKNFRHLYIIVRTYNDGGVQDIVYGSVQSQWRNMTALLAFAHTSFHLRAPGKDISFSGARLSYQLVCKWLGLDWEQGNTSDNKMNFRRLASPMESPSKITPDPELDFIIKEIISVPKIEDDDSPLIYLSQVLESAYIPYTNVQITVHQDFSIGEMLQHLGRVKDIYIYQSNLYFSVDLNAEHTVKEVKDYLQTTVDIDPENLIILNYGELE